MSQPDIDHIRDDIEKVESLITSARRLLSEGRMVDLSALEDRVRELTMQFTTANADSTQSLRPAIESLIDSLNSLEEELEAHQSELRENLDRIKREKAGNAYKKEEN